MRRYCQLAGGGGILCRHALSLFCHELMLISISSCNCSSIWQSRAARMITYGCGKRANCNLVFLPVMCLQNESRSNVPRSDAPDHLPPCSQKPPLGQTPLSYLLLIKVIAHFWSGDWVNEGIWSGGRGHLTAKYSTHVRTMLLSMDLV